MKKSKKKNNLKGLFLTIICISILMGIGYYLYTIYQNIDIENDNYLAERTMLSTQYEQTVEKDENNSKSVADTIENITKSVCGISKLTNTGNSILSTTTETKLGLGTGVIVSSNGYILSNAHVTGEKYSTCYVTIEERDTYKGTVLWSDTDLDLSITKINVKNLPYVTFR